MQSGHELPAKWKGLDLLSSPLLLWIQNLTAPLTAWFLSGDLLLEQADTLNLC